MIQQTIFDAIRHADRVITATAAKADRARKLRDNGMAATLAAEREEVKREIIEFAKVYAATTPLFKMEDVRAAYLAKGGTEPHTHNVWGAITTGLIKDGVMVYEKHVQSVSPKTHGHRVPLYRSLKWAA